MLEYLDSSIVNAFRQVLGGFGVIFILAFLMWLISQRRRGEGAGKLGKTYYYFVAPGVMFHELGHAIGCVLTFTKIHKIGFFQPQGDRLGYVQHEMPVNSRLGAIKSFIIATGPVWLGCAVISFASWLMSGSGFLPNYSEVFTSGTPGMIEYAIEVFWAALHMLTSLIFVWKWTSPTYLILLYLLFCVTSEIALSDVDISHCWRGTFVMIALVILLNLIPGINIFATRLSDFCAPGLFVVHSSMLFVLMIDIAFYFLFKTVTGFFKIRSRSHRRRR